MFAEPVHCAVCGVYLSVCSVQCSVKSLWLMGPPRVGPVIILSSNTSFMEYRNSVNLEISIKCLYQQSPWSRQPIVRSFMAKSRILLEFNKTSHAAHTESKRRKIYLEYIWLHNWRRKKSFTLIFTVPLLIQTWLLLLSLLSLLLLLLLQSLMSLLSLSF